MLHIAVKILCRCNDHTLVIFKIKELSRTLNFVSQIYTFSCMDPEWFICKILREVIFPDLCDAIHASRTPQNILVTARTTWSGKTECGTRRLICQDRKRETRSLPINAFLWLTRHTQLPYTCTATSLRIDKTAPNEENLIHFLPALSLNGPTGAIRTGTVGANVRHNGMRLQQYDNGFHVYVE